MRQTNCAHTVIMQLFLITRLISSGNSVLRMLMQTWGQGFGIILKSLLVNFLFILRNFHQRNPTNCAELYINDQANIIDILEGRPSSVFTRFKSKNTREYFKTNCNSSQLRNENSNFFLFIFLSIVHSYNIILILL